VTHNMSTYDVTVSCGYSWSVVLVTVAFLTMAGASLDLAVAGAGDSVSSSDGGSARQELSPVKSGPGEAENEDMPTSNNICCQPHRGTFTVKLDHAPYPYTGKYADSGEDFFDDVDRQTGERFHTNRYGERFSEREHYSDGSVLFHIPPRFNPREPFAYVLFFHGMNSDIQSSNRDYMLNRQIEGSEKNVILIMPQLAKNAADSSPGKLFRKNGFKALMDEATGVLVSVVGVQYRQRLKSAPIILTAFSGGYKAAALVLDRGGVESRVRGVLLMDALYEDVDRFQKWARKNIRKGFLISMFTSGSCESNSRQLASRLGQVGIAGRNNWPEANPKGGAYFVATDIEHMQVPIWGPPRQPLASLLRVLDLRSIQ
jgi:hypothetical protein